MVHIKTMGASKIMEDVDITAKNPVTAVKEDAVHKTTGIGVESVVVANSNLTHYFWTHGMCAHPGTGFRTPSDVH